MLLGLSLTRHRRSVIFRREAAQGRSMIDRSHELLGGLARWNGQHSVWREIPGGRSLEFGGVKDAADVQKWRGRPHDFIGIDEADGFLESQVRFLMGWLRTTTPGQRCRVVLCFNPPASAEGRWLLSYFGPWLDKKHPRPAAPGELRWYAMVDGKEVERPDGRPFEHRGETLYPKSRTFIPARVQDNPHLMGTGYWQQLLSLPEPLRSQLAYGDFEAGLEDDPWQVIPTAWVEAAMARWRPDGGEGVPLSAVGVDVAWGGADKTVLARRHRTWFAPLEKHPGKSTPDGQAAVGLILQALAGHAQAVVAVDVIGYGASAYDQCKGRVKNLQGVNFGEATEARDRSGVLEFSNLRAWAYWSLREALDPERVKPEDALALPPDPELLADLTAGRWEMTTRGVKIEPKEDITARIGRSPDCGDAVALAHLARPKPPPGQPAAGTQRSPAYGYQPR